MSVTTVRLEQGIEERLTALGERLQRNRSWLINQAVKEYTERQELEQRRWQETLEALDGVARGEVVDGEQVLAWLRTWGSGSDKPFPLPGA